ncbi:hypothetical protein NL676_036931 [Syzygium grande]|nr:hypothetical protein NL676_036931 [Syzygium grande]
MTGVDRRGEVDRRDGRGRSTRSSAGGSSDGLRFSRRRSGPMSVVDEVEMMVVSAAFGACVVEPDCRNDRPMSAEALIENFRGLSLFRMGNDEMKEDVGSFV